MLTLALLLADAITPATMRYVNVTEGNYPAGPQRRGEQAVVPITIVVSPEGTVERCVILQPSPYEELNNATCSAAILRMRLTAARDEGGAPIWSVLRTAFTWRLDRRGDAPQTPPQSAEIELDVARLPDGSREPVTLDVHVLVAADGSLARCVPPEGTPQPALAQAACRAMPALWTPAPLWTPSGERVRHIRTLGVRFTPASPNE